MLTLQAFYKRIKMDRHKYYRIDLGGTNIRAGLANENFCQKLFQKKSMHSAGQCSGTIEEVLEELFSLTDELINSSVIAIGIGVPG